MICIDKAELDREIEAGYIKMLKHPFQPLWLLNYTDKCTYDKHWTDLTRMCRGLVIDTDYCIVARPFPKFFNINEMEETKEENLPGGIPKVTVKEDGSLGILFNYDGVWHMCTRGSWTSEQAKEGMKLFREVREEWLDWLIPDCTYCLEIIYPENRIVHDYGKERKLVTLAAFDTDGYEWEDPRHPFEKAEVVGLTLSTMLKLKAENRWQEGEGWVAKYPNGLRVKIKTDDYLRMHRLKHLCTPLTIWEMMREGVLNDYMMELPEEFREGAEEIERELSEQYQRIRLEVVREELEIDYNQRDKAVALQIKRIPNKHIQGCLFALWRKGSCSDYIWKMIRPKGNTMVDTEWP